jgi:phosphoadenosine phosphosulfate reductase
MPKNSLINFANTLLEQNLSTVENLQLLSQKYKHKVCFSSSMSVEDQVITDFIFANHLDIKVFTLQTGRLFPETTDLIGETQLFYGEKIEIYEPIQENVDALIKEKGAFSFYDSVENRKECCFIRKVEPLERALAGQQIWITGIRAEHSEHRNELTPIEWDEKHQLLKYHPLLFWSFDEVMSYLHKNGIPYNKMQDRGYKSIGCLPCTRALKEGEHFRAGRWWWEEADKKECGLHSS